MLGISAAKLAANLEVGIPPEPREISRDLNGPIGRREEVQRERNRTTRDSGCLREPEQLLQPHSEYGRVRIRIVHANVGAAWHLERRGREHIELRALLPAQSGEQQLRQIQRLYLIAATQSEKMWQEP